MTQNRRRQVLVSAGALLAVPRFLVAQQPQKVWRVGFLGVTSASSSAHFIQALLAGLREQGYSEGRNLEFVSRWADGKYGQLPALAAELVDLKVDVLVAQGTPGALAAKKATASIPIVMPSISDPVENGLVASLARPGGNITGLTYFAPELAAKQLEILREFVPRAKRIAAMVNPFNPASVAQFKSMAVAATSLKLEIQKFEARRFDEAVDAVAAISKAKLDAVAFSNDPLFYSNAEALAVLMLRARLPSIGFREYAEAGGLLAYGVDRQALWKRAALVVDKLLKGADPATMPVERATNFELLVNRKTANALGIKIQPALLVRADKVLD